ncbi:hypothetical protein GCM10018785_24340 [Streptomyces longispororuber]|uniref:Uncharacterized protein n=1 Tax=Streptomyces longispororuber TaxID=68230 RepID=A0A919DJH7_9ACTN|nr:hypothetical protein GCM10018785_24340 [Streptomyces longispororuber]
MRLPAGTGAEDDRPHRLDVRALVFHSALPGSDGGACGGRRAPRADKKGEFPRAVPGTRVGTAPGWGRRVPARGGTRERGAGS